MPKRIQRKRTKGWRMPPNTIYVGRGSKWGNPIKLSGDIIMIDAGYRRKKLDKWVMFCCGDIFDVLRIYSGLLNQNQFRDNDDYIYWKEHFKKLDIKELEGYDLACWCNLNDPCHVDILLEKANRCIRRRV